MFNRHKKNSMVSWMTFTGIVVFASCYPIKRDQYSNDYCGYVISEPENSNLLKRMNQDSSSYQADSLWNLYDQINDTLRSAVADTIEFEIFMTLLNEMEIGIQVWAPGGNEFYQTVTCKIMNANYQGKMPSQRYAVLYQYANKDGSIHNDGDLIFVKAIKREK